MGDRVFVELTMQEALLLQTVLQAIGKGYRETEMKNGKDATTSADIMKISMKVTTGIVQSFLDVGGADGNGDHGDK